MRLALRRLARWLSLALAVSLLGAWEGCHLMGSLNEPIPGVVEALHAHADALPATPPRPSRRVVVVLVDGLGGDAFDARLAEGALGDVAWRVSLDSGVPSRSRPVYHAILTGVTQWASGIRGNGFATARADGVPDRVRAGGGKVAWMLESEPWFCELFCAPEDVVVGGDDARAPEAFAKVWDGAPDLLVLHLVGVDDAGHLYGAESDEYAAASRAAFATVASFRAAARAKGGRPTVWFVGADHGHTPHGGHGGVEQAVRRVTWIALADPPFAAGGESGAASVPAMTPVTGLASTFARVLGVSAPAEAMADGLPFFPAAVGEPWRASPTRNTAVERARASADAGFLHEPTSRAALILGGLATSLALLIAARRGLREATVCAIAVGGFFVAGPGLSMSAVRTQGWYLTEGLVSLTVFAAIAWAVLRRGASATACAIFVGVFPVLALAAMRGSLGRSDVTPLESVLWPSLGLVPPSVCAAMALVEGVVHALTSSAPRKG